MSAPNIVLILCDQYRFDCLSALGPPVVQTPNLDRLAQDGVLFTRAYCATMACGPARASLFTGHYADTHGMHRNAVDMDPPDLPVLPEYLREAGYDTALVGKLHVHPFERRFGFRYFLRNDAPYTNYSAEEAGPDNAYLNYLAETCFKGKREEAARRFTEDEACLKSDELRFMLGSNVVDEEHHMTPWTARESIRYIREKRKEPFFLNISFFGPHQPYLCPGKWETLYDPATLPLPADFRVEGGDKPIFRHSRQHWRYREQRDARGWDESVYRRLLAAYYGNISMIDHYLGTVFDALREEGLWDNTIIVFTSDHGDYAGQMRLFYKGLPYEGSVHVPLIIRDPRAGRHGVHDDACVNTVDLLATSLAVAEVAVPADSESRDLGPLIAGDRTAWENRTFWKCGAESALVRDRFKLMRGPAAGAPAYEFYDLDEQPVEMRNRLADPDCARTVADMKAELDAWHEDQDAILGQRAKRQETGRRPECATECNLPA